MGKIIRIPVDNEALAIYSQTLEGISGEIIEKVWGLEAGDMLKVEPDFSVTSPFGLRDLFSFLIHVVAAKEAQQKERYEVIFNEGKKIYEIKRVL